MEKAKENILKELASTVTELQLKREIFEALFPTKEGHRFKRKRDEEAAKIEEVPKEKDSMEELKNWEEEVKRIDQACIEKKREEELQLLKKKSEEEKQKEREKEEPDESKQCMYCCVRGRKACYDGCGHTGCYICLKWWMDLGGDCPMCKKKITGITEPHFD